MALAQVGAYTLAAVAAAVCTALAPVAVVECKLAVAAVAVAVLVELLSVRPAGRSTLHISGRRRHCLLSQSYSWGRG